jgi:hypothetical protein
MKPDYRTKIKISKKTGRKCLIVYYDSKKDDYDKAIDQAIALHGIRDKHVTVIAMPA